MKKQFKTTYYTCQHGSVDEKHYYFRIISNNKQRSVHEFTFDNMNEDIMAFKGTVEKMESQKNLHTQEYENQMLHDSLLNILYSLRGDYEYKKLIRGNIELANIMEKFEQTRARHNNIAPKNKNALSRARLAEPDAGFQYYQIPGEVIARNNSEHLYNHTPSNSLESTDITQPYYSLSSDSQDMADTPSQPNNNALHPMLTRSRTHSPAMRDTQPAAAAAAPVAGHKRKSLAEESSNQADYPKSPPAAAASGRYSFNASAAAFRSLSLYNQKKSSANKDEKCEEEESVQEFKKPKSSSKKK